MRTHYRFTYVLLISVATGWLNAGCEGDNQQAANPQADCRIARISATTTSSISEGRDETVYEYDANENLSKKTRIMAIQYKTGPASSNTTETETFSYNDANFLATHVHEQVIKDVGVDGKAYDNQHTLNKAYTYTDGRLTGYTMTSVEPSYDPTRPQPLTIITTGVYEYDIAGQLTKEKATSGSTQRTWTYQNGQAVDYVEKHGATEYRPFTLQNGLIVKANFPSTSSATDGPYNLVQVKEYDAQRRLTKHQELINDNMDRYYTQDWQTGKPATAALPSFKGHPAESSVVFGEAGLITKHDYFHANRVNKAVQHYSSSTSTHQLNAHGFVVNTTTETRYLNPQTLPQTETTITTYTYTGCN